MEKNPVYFLKKDAGTWRSNGVVPDVPADYIGRPPRLGKLVAFLLTEEACRMWEARQEERGNFFSKNAADLGRAGLGGGWLQCAVSRCWILLEGLATRMRLR
jgi:hypothetical protein